MNALDRLAGSYKTECDSLQRELSLAETQLRDYQARLGKPFEHDAYLTGLAALRDQLKVALSGTAPEPTTEALPTAADLAGQIKALRAAQVIEAAPERIGKRPNSAEEPVTARIRRRLEATLGSR